MTAGTRPLVLDVTPLFAQDDLGERDVARALARRCGLAVMVRLGERGIERVEAAAADARVEALRMGSPDALSATRRWLIDGGERPIPAPVAKARRRMAWVRRTWPAWLPQPSNSALPPRAALIRIGFGGWGGPHLQPMLDRRPDLAPLALVGFPSWLDWPEYDSAADVATLRRDLAALCRSARAIVLPDVRARARFLAATAGRDAPPILIEPPPSALAGTEAPVFDADLAAVPYVITPGPIDARANSLLLLQIWRALTQEGDSVPKLVLAGARGRQIEEIRPLLDWNPVLARHVVEAPHLPPQALRHLMAHARAVLRPAFVEPSCALIRAAAALGLPVIAANGAAEGAISLSPIDGRGWLEAIRAHAGRPAVAVSPASLPDGTTYAERIARIAETLP